MIGAISSSIDGRTLPGYAGLRVMPAMSSKSFPSDEDIYRILDQVLETGVPVEIERHGKLLKIVPVEAEENGFPVFAVSEGAGPITLATVQKAFEEAE
jgi:hypothetical protein